MPEYDIEAGAKKLTTIAAENALAALLRGSHDLAKMAANAIRASELLRGHRSMLPTLDGFCEFLEPILPAEPH